MVAPAEGVPKETVLVDDHKVHVKADAHGGAGAYAACDIAKGDVVEKGIVRRLTNCDGHENPYACTAFLPDI